MKRDICQITKADLHFPDRGIEVSIEVHYSKCSVQCVSIPLTDNVNDFWEKVKNLQIMFQIHNLRELEGKYCYSLLSDDVNPIIKGFRLLEPDIRYSDSEYNEVILK